MTKPETLNFIIEIPIFNFDLMVSIGESGSELKEKVSQVLPSTDKVEDRLFEFTNSLQGRAIMFPCNACLLWIKHNPKETGTYGYLQHELLHIIEFIMGKINVPMGEDGSETWNYLIAWLTDRIYEKL